MNQNALPSAFAKLHEYDKRSHRFNPGSNGASGPAEEWSGVTFGLAGARMVCHIDHVHEILPCPQATPVPGAQQWIVGLANVRGELLTLIDLGCYLTGARTPISNNSRVLSASLNRAPVGLLVDEVHGQRHFLDSDGMPADLEQDSPLRRVVSKQYSVGSESWQELDLDLLFNSAEFLNGAAH